MERIGIYGGTFNPPHAGHIQAAKQAVTALKLDKLVIVPTSIAPHKEIPEHSPTPRQRLEMLRIAAADCPKAGSPSSPMFTFLMWTSVVSVVVRVSP